MPTIKMSEIRAKYPEYGALNDDQLLQGIHNTFYKQMTPGEFASHIDYDTQREQMARENTAGTGLFENFQAGVNTFLKGRDQAFGKINSALGLRHDPLLNPEGDVTEEDVAFKRHADESLAKATSGGGFMQGVGEALPAMAVPVAGGEALAAKLGGGVLGRLAGMSAGGAGAGAVTGAVAPVAPGESRVTNTIRGGEVGAALPGALKLASVPLKAVASHFLRVFSKTDAQRRAAQAVAQHIPDEEMPGVLGELGAAQGADVLPGRLARVPTSAAQATGNPFVVQAEAATRARPGAGGADWTNFSGDRNAALYENVQRMAPSELRLKRLGRARDLVTGPMREDAQAAAAAAGDYLTPIQAHLTDLASSDAAGNRNVRRMVASVMEDLGEDPTPGRIYSVRKWLADTLDAPARIGDDEASAAVKSVKREARGIIKSIDDSLDSASQGQWSDYLTTYGKRSAPINEGRALRNIADDMARQPLVGRTPEVTFTKYRNALEQHGVDDFGTRLGPQAQQETQALLQNMKVAEGGARSRKLSGTMGGGSQTNIDQQLGDLASGVMGAIGATHGLPLSTASKWISSLNREAVEREMARIQQSPTTLAAALRELSPNQRQLLVQQLVNNTAVSGGAAAATDR